MDFPFPKYPWSFHSSGTVQYFSQCSPLLLFLSQKNEMEKKFQELEAGVICPSTNPYSYIIVMGIHVDISGHPPITTGSKQSFRNLLFLAVF